MDKCIHDTAAEKMQHEKDMYINQNREQNIARTYEEDRLYLQRIKTGDVEAVRALQAARHHEIACGQAEKISSKQMEYTVCAAITLATHAAIDGGLDPASAYAMNELYLRRLARCKDMADMQQLYDEMELVFTRQVNLVLEQRANASYVEKCKLFIEQHLINSFTLDDIAAALNVNKSYLSRRFAQEAGMRIMEYAREKRIETAAYMLKYTDQTIAAIAANFCFPTQSHFGDWFKRLTGTTPLKYRTANQVIEVELTES